MSNRSIGCLEMSPGGGYIKFREPGTTVTNICMIIRETSPKS